MSVTDGTAPKRELVQKLGRGQGTLYAVRLAGGKTGFVHVYSDAGNQHEVRLRATTLTEARKECAARNVKKDEGRLLAPTTITFGEVAAEFLAMQHGLLEEGRRSARRVQLYDQRYIAHLQPSLGRRRFQQITPSHISVLLSDLRSKKGRRGHMTGSTRAGILRLASAIFAFGVSRGYRDDSPIQYLAPQERPESKPSTKARALSDDECSKLIRATRPGLRSFVAFLAYTGVRLSEGLGLRWGNLNLVEGTLTISAQLERWKQGQTPKLKGLKTDNGYRTIDLHPALVSLLREQRKGALARGLHRDDCFVFCTEDGRRAAPPKRRQRHRGCREEGRSQQRRATSRLGPHAPSHVRLSADRARSGRGRGRATARGQTRHAPKGLRPGLPRFAPPGRDPAADH